MLAISRMMHLLPPVLNQFLVTQNPAVLISHFRLSSDGCLFNILHGAKNKHKPFNFIKIKSLLSASS